MSFVWPLYLWGLLLVPLAAVGYVVLQRRRQRYAARFTNLDLLGSIVERSPAWRRHVPPALLLLALSALLVGAARPQRTVDVPTEEASVVLTMDTSLSMIATDVAPNRFDAAQAAASTFVDRVPDTVKIGVVRFSTAAEVLTPPTEDRDVVHRALDGMRPDGGTALGDAIVRSAEFAREPDTAESDDGAAAPSGSDPDDDPPLVVLLLSDGANTQGRTEPAEAAAQARALGVPVYTVALGTEGGTIEVPDPASGQLRSVEVPPDLETLRSVAEETGGQFFEAPDDAALEQVYEELGSRVGTEQEEQEITAAFAAAGAALLLGAGALSALWFNRLV